MVVAAFANSFRSGFLVGLRQSLTKTTPNHLSSRSVFYTQRKRPATSDEMLILIVGTGALLSSALVVSTVYVYRLHMLSPKHEAII